MPSKFGWSWKVGRDKEGHYPDRMVFFSKAAATTELRTVKMVEEAIEHDTWLDHGRTMFPCHIVNEVHTGVWVGRHQGNGGKIGIGVYRCQNVFWGVILDIPQIEAAKRGENLNAQILAERRAEPGLVPIALSPMAAGTKTLAEILNKIDYAGV